MKFSYTLKSLRKHIEFDLDKNDYSIEEVSKILKNVLSTVDIVIMQERENNDKT